MQLDPLRAELQRLSRRRQKLQRSLWLSLVWLLGSLLLGAMLLVPRLVGGVTVGTVTGIVLLIAVSVLRLTPRADLLRTTRTLESHFPDLNARLLTALEQYPDVRTGMLNFFQQQILRQAWNHHREHNWFTLIPSKQLLLWRALHGLAMGTFLGLIAWNWNLVETASESQLAAAETETGTHAGEDFGLRVEPGDTRVERGSPLVVLAHFDRQLPSEVSLVLIQADGFQQELEMVRSLDDPLFACRIPPLEHFARYYLEYAGQRSPDYTIEVFEYPRVTRLDVQVTFPDYLQHPPLTLEDTQQVSVVEGATLQLRCHVNKPLASVSMQRDSAAALALHSVEPHLWEVSLIPTASGVYRLELQDERGRKNAVPAELQVTVLPNRRPELKLTFPGKDLKVSPLEEVAIEGTTWDDFGVQRFGVVYSLAGQPPRELTLGQNLTGEGQLSFLLPLEDLQARPDQLLSYHLFAEDYGPDGTLRRTFSDLFFAEVRPFDEIFRQGQQPPQNGQQQQQSGSPQQQKLEELTRQQKEIINATWKIIRRESGAKISGEFAGDVGTLLEAQQGVIQAVQELAGKLNSPESRAAAEQTTGFMRQAVESLQSALEKNSAESLPPALVAEQQAWQSLLRLQAKEHKVSQSQNGSGQGSSGSRSQQQMQQLELNNKQNRYQTRQQAEQKQPSVNREQLQVLNRLRELAQRQEAVNQQLKELEAMLREAQTAEEQEEIKRRLKRLREEQDQQLRDVDELRQRMEQPENQSQMQQAKQELEQTRQQLRETSEALKQGRLSQALNSGTKAERELQQMQQEFRQQTASQFTEAMRDLKQQADELQEEQQKISEQLDETKPENRPGLGQPMKTQQQAQQSLQAQQQRLQQIDDEMRKLTQQAEQSEPLLARQLYETARRLHDAKPGEKLQATQKLLNQGSRPEAKQAEQQARQAIEELQRGIDQAARGVLGDEAEALRRARQELNQVARSLQQEMQQSRKDNGQPGEPQSGQQPRSPEKQSGEQKPGEGKPGEQKPGQQPGEVKPGQQPGEGKPGAQPGEGKPGEQPGMNQPGQSPGQQAPGEQPGQSSESTPSRQPRSPQEANRPHGLRPQQASQTGGEQNGSGGPLTGEGFQEWSDQLRDVEEMLSNPELRAEVAKVRQRARQMRVEFKRHSREPNWGMVSSSLLQPLAELQQKIAEEEARQNPQQQLVPIDRDPVPRRYSEIVNRYFENLGEK